MFSSYQKPKNTAAVPECSVLEPDFGSRMPLPVAGYSIQGGFPSPAEDFLESRLDLNDLLIARPAATFYLRYQGDSMRDAGLHPGDILVVDRAESPRHGDIVVAVVDGEMTCKRLYNRAGLIRLDAEHPEFPNIELRQDSELVIWGVVTAAVKRFKTTRAV
ncbi:protein ImpA [gamma proteobacterium HTCC5015]|nr:protein ImpA [gamma proteobacterium HTCC5015]